MSVFTQVGQFALSTGSASTVVNCNFLGKCAIFFTHGKTGNAESAGASFSMGFTDGTNNHCVSWAGDDAVATTNTAKGNQTVDALQIFTDGTPTIGTGGTITAVSFGASTFTLTLNTTPASAWLVDFILIGGTDISNVFVGSTAMPTVAGTLNVVNASFKGDFVLMASTQQTGATTTATGLFSVGCATSSTKRWSFGQAVQDAIASSASVNGQTIMRSDNAMVGQTTLNAVNILADFTQFTSTGFDLNFATAPASAFLLHYIIIKGGYWDCGTSAKPTTATAQQVTGQSFSPLLLGLFTSSPTASNTNVSNAVASFGATDETNQCYANAFHNDAVNTVAKSAGDSVNVLLDRDGVNNPAASITSFNSDGWTITWGATGSARQVGWFTVANPDATTILNALSVNIS